MSGYRAISFERKKRPRRFTGTQWHLISSGDPEVEPREDPEPEEVEEETLIVRSASSRKLAKISPSTTHLEGFTSGSSSTLLRPRPRPGEASSEGVSGADSWVMKGNRIIGCEAIVSLVNQFEMP